MTLRDVCVELGPAIRGLTHRGQAVDGARLLWAIAGCESDHGRLREFVRAEAAYLPGGTYFAAKHLKEAYARFGIIAGCSLGSWQVLAIVALELGLQGNPITLQNDRTCGYWATELITRRFIKSQGAKTLTAVLDAYNSGNGSDANVPVAYVNKGISFYEGDW